MSKRTNHRENYIDYFFGRGAAAFFFSPVSKAASICCNFAINACFSAPSAASAVCTRAVSIYERQVSIVAGLERELFGTFDLELTGTSERAESLAVAPLRADSGTPRALLGAVPLSSRAELSLAELFVATKKEE